MKVLALLHIGFHPLWSVSQSPYGTVPKQAIKIQKNVSNATVLVYRPFLVYFFPKHLESSRISLLVHVCIGGSY